MMPARILLLGGIGSGKTLVASILGDLGAFVIAADEIGHEVLAPGTAATQAVLAMWPEVGIDGAIDRTRLGRLVFADQAELSALETITHPAIRRRIADEAAAHPDDVVLVEMPILRDWFDDSWIRLVVDAPRGTRIERTLERDGGRMTRPDVEQIIERQPTRSALLECADFVLDNSGDAESLEDQCAELWERVTRS